MSSVSTWQPGEPLHQHPWYRPEGDTQTVRHMIDVHDDAAHTWDWFQRSMAHCERCQVAWRMERPNHTPAPPLTCWMCGGKGQPPREPF